MRRIWAAVFVSMSCATASFAHYNMLLPDKAWASKGDKVTFTYQFGHPFEHELFDAPKPLALAVFLPNGKIETLDLDKVLTPIKKDGADGKKVGAWQFTFVPPQRGDYTFFLKTAKIKQDDGKSIEDIVKVVLHVQTQNGWDMATTPWRENLDLNARTRPYGLYPGMAFQGRVATPDKADNEHLTVEFEKYNSKPMKNPLPDELITFKTKTGHNGDFVTTFPEAGWWGVTATGNNGEQRITHWIHVDEKK